MILRGEGLEIGGMHNPLHLPKKCSVKYLDIESPSSLKLLFKEVEDSKFVDVNYIGDIGKSTILEITGTQFDFIIINHVLEHVANPIQVIENVWCGIKENGWLVISVPDKNCTFDKTRPLTTFEHLSNDYSSGINEVPDEHYIEFLKYVHPEAFADNDIFIEALCSVRKRREHVHVWDSLTFKDHLVKIFNLLGIKYSIIYESNGFDNGLEYFIIIQKGENGIYIPTIKLKMFLSFYKYRDYLKKGLSKIYFYTSDH